MLTGARVAAALALLATPLGVARAQNAAPLPGLSLEWEAPAGCPDGAALRAEVARLLGRAPRPGDPPLLARGRITPAARGGYRLELETTAPATAGRRDLSDRSCEQLAGAAALVIALAIDPGALAGPSPSPAAAAGAPPVGAGARVEPAAAATRPTVPAPRRAAGPPAAAAPPPRPPLVRVGARASVLLDFGTLPALAAPGLGLAAVLDLGLGRIEAGGAYWFAQRRGAAAVAPGVEAEVSMAAAQLRGCVVPLRARVEFGVCAGTEAGAQFGRGINLSEPAADAGPWVAALVGATLEWRVVGPLVLRAALDAVFPLTAPAFVINEQTVHQAAVPSARGALGAGLHFP